MNKIIYCDMDEVLADFSGSKELKTLRYNPPEMYVPGFFLNLEVKAGARDVIHELIHEGYDVHILTQPVAMSPISYTEKAQWILKHFPVLASKISMTQDKGLFKGAYLIDDNLKWKDPFENNGGKFIHFKLDELSENMWNSVYAQIKVHEWGKQNDNVTKATTSI